MEIFAEDLLSFNMIQEGAFRLNPQSFNPKDTLNFIKQTFDSKSNNKRVKIITKFNKIEKANKAFGYESSLLLQPPEADSGKIILNGNQKKDK